MRGESERPPHEGAEPGLDPEQRGPESSAVGASEQKRLATEGSRTRQSARLLDEGGEYVQDEDADKPRLAVSRESMEERRSARDSSTEVLRQIEGLGFKEGDPIAFTWDSGDTAVRIEQESGTFIEVDDGMLIYIDKDGSERGTAVSVIRSIQKPFP